MKRSKLVLILYIIAGLLGVLTIVNVFTSIAYISTYTAQYGMSIGDMLGDAVTYIMQNSVSYLIYGILVFTGAKILECVQELKANSIGTCGCSNDEFVEEVGAYEEVASEVEEAAEEAVETEAVEAEDAEGGNVPPLYTSNSFIKH